MSIPPALVVKSRALAPVPAEANRNSWVLPPATAISRSLPEPVTVKFESSSPSMDIVVASTVIPVVAFISTFAPEVIIIGFAAKVTPVVPSCVSVASLPAPSPRTELSVSRYTSFPAITSLATDKPPSVCN